MAYNGWSNYETWNVKLWMDNEESSYRYWNETANQLGRHCSDKDKAVGKLSTYLKDHYEEYKPDLGASVWSDLLGAALSEVDWYEIAESLLEDVEFEPEEVEADNAE